MLASYSYTKAATTCVAYTSPQSSSTTATWCTEDASGADFAMGELEPEPEQTPSEEMAYESPGEHPVCQHINQWRNMPAWPWPSGFL